MSCLFPSTVRVKKGRSFEYIQVPCRKCLNCRIQRQSDLEFSCMLAAQQAYRRGLGCSFVTLTYSNNTVPLVSNSNFFVSGKPELNMTLLRKDFVDFNKRLRQHVKRNYGFDFQFICCGEYGDSTQFTHRPHYHALFFGLDSVISNSLVRKSWKNGIVDVGTLGPGGIRYVVDYIMKQNETEYAKLYDDIGIERPFLLHSVKLGNDYFMNDFPYTQDFRYMRKGRPAIIPATYRRKIDTLRQFEYFDSEGHLEASKVGLNYPTWQVLQAVCRAENYVIKSRHNGKPCFAVPPQIVDYSNSYLGSTHVIFPDDPSSPTYRQDYKKAYIQKYGFFPEL